MLVRALRWSCRVVRLLEDLALHFWYLQLYMPSKMCIKSMLSRFPSKKTLQKLRMAERNH